ncbi:MAG: hypothetical protein ACE5R4_16275 [Armatimonadota bacterium]
MTEYGKAIERKRTESPVVFETPAGLIVVFVYKARNPDVDLPGVEVTLLEEGGTPARYRVMVDDPWWGRRIQPAEFKEAPFTEHIVMGYRLEARTLLDGVPQNGEGLSLELVWETAEDGEVVGWFPDVHNSLIWSSQEQTYVRGPEPVWPIVTRYDGSRAEDGWAGFDWPGLRSEDVILPKGHGSIFQRASDELYDGWLGEEGNELPRYVKSAEWVYKTLRQPAVEGSPAIFDLKPGTVTFVGAAGADYEYGLFDQDNPATGGGTLDQSGQAERELEPCEYWAWQHDDAVGIGDRVSFTLEPGEEKTVNLPAMRTSGILVYEGGAKPAAGVTIYKGSTNIPLGQTDQNGYWTGQEAPGDINDPVLGYQSPGAGYAGVVYAVMGGRMATAKWLVWRDIGVDHPNFKFVPGGVWVRRQEDGGAYAVEEAAGRHWSYVTEEPVPRNSQADSIPTGDPEVRLWDPSTVVRYHYEVLRGEEVLGITQLEPPETNQPSGGHIFSPGPTIGGKVKGDLLRQDEDQVSGTDAPFKLIEFGRHEWFLEHRQLASGGGQHSTCFADLLCPYCGGRAWVEPDEHPYYRGYCQYCTATWGVGMKTDCRGYFESKALGVG